MRTSDKYITVATASQEKAIVYDNNCPMCQLYTQGFVQAQMLKPENRIAFTCLPPAIAEKIDLERSRHEIPLVDLAGGKTLYGLDSLLFMIGSRLPFLAKIAHFAPFYYFFKVLYALVSYNRRVIIQTPKQTEGFDCAPDFHVGYRLSFIGLSIGMAMMCLGWSWQASWAVLTFHYLLPFLESQKRTEMLGQLSVSIWIACFFVSLSAPLAYGICSILYARRVAYLFRV
jgi:hypothetical protein